MPSFETAPTTSFYYRKQNAQNFVQDAKAAIQSTASQTKFEFQDNKRRMAVPLSQKQTALRQLIQQSFRINFPFSWEELCDKLTQKKGNDQTPKSFQKNASHVLCKTKEN